MEITRAEAYLFHMLILDRSKTRAIERGGFIHRVDSKLQAEETWHGSLLDEKLEAEIDNFLK